MPDDTIGGDVVQGATIDGETVQEITMDGGVVWATGGSGGAKPTDTWVHFDGVDDYGESPSVGIGGAAFSVATTIRFDSITTYGKVMSAASSLAYSSAIWTLEWDNSDRLAINGTKSLQASQSLTGTWFRLVATSTTSGSTLALYDMDGVEVGSVSGGGRSSPGNIKYWMMEAGYGYQPGDVAECVLFNDQLSSGERAAYGADGTLPSDSVVAEYPIDTGSGSTLTDIANGNDMELHGGTWESA